MKAIRLKVTLVDAEPAVWRRLLVTEDTTLGDLHMAVQAAMGWENSHLHLFEAGRARYGQPRMLDGVENEAKVSVGEVAAKAPVVAPTLGFQEALERLRASGLPALPVVDATGRLVGLLTMDNITDLLLVRRAGSPLST